MLVQGLPAIRRLHRQAVSQNVPLYVLFELTHRCNHRCHHCYVSPQGDGELTLGQVCRVLDQLAEEGCLYLVLTGGEVFLRADLFDIMAYARKRDFAVRLFTNGTLITPEIADRLQGLGPLEVAISLHGARPETHDLVTGIPGSFQRAVAALGLLRERGLFTRIKCNLMAENIDEFDQIRALARDLGVQAQFDPKIMPRVDGSLGPTRHQCPEEPLVDIWAQDTKYTAEVQSWWASTEELLRRPLCLAGRDSLAITPQGIVKPCLMLPMPCGDLRQQPLREIWRGSPVLDQLRGMTFADLPLCHQCELAWYCTRCPALSLQEGQGLIGCPSLDRRLAQTRAKAVEKGVAHG